MSDAHDPLPPSSPSSSGEPLPPLVLPVRYPPPPRRGGRSSLKAVLLTVLLLAFVLSLLLNVLLIGVGGLSLSESNTLQERSG